MPGEPGPDNEEDVMQEGLRILARIIARHHFAHPELYHRVETDSDSSASGGDESASRDEADA